MSIEAIYVESLYAVAFDICTGDFASMFGSIIPRDKIIKRRNVEKGV